MVCLVIDGGWVVCLVIVFFSTILLTAVRKTSCYGTRVLLNVRPTLPWGGGGWVGLAEFQGGWVSNHPPPPRVGWDFVGALGLLSQCHFFLSSVAGSPRREVDRQPISP